MRDRAHDFTFENDCFFHTDHFYTNGVQFEARQRTDSGAQAPSFEGDRLNASRHKIGQLMYTPTRIDISGPQPHDRPWAGLLYYDADYLFLSSDARTLTTFAFEVGVTGPKSFAGDTQRFVHQLIGNTLPQGWGNQIGGSLGLLGSMERRRAWDALSLGEHDGVQLRGERYWRLAAGNIFTYAAGGATAVLGKGLPAVSGAAPGSIENKLMREASRTCLFDWLECTAFANLEARLLARNVFLDGRIGHDDPHVEKRPWVADASLGVHLGFPWTRNECTGPWFLQFRATHRTAEFKSTSSVPGQNFGALTVGTDF